MATALGGRLGGVVSVMISRQFSKYTIHQYHSSCKIVLNIPDHDIRQIISVLSDFQVRMFL